MARLQRTLTITAAGRDKGKAFLLKEMPAEQGEWWAVRALILLANAGTALPEGSLDAGMAGLAAAEASTGVVTAMLAGGVRMLPGIDPDRLKPLLDEMMGNVLYQPPAGLPAQDLLPGELCQIEEVATRLQLRAELISLHVGFSVAGGASTSGTTPASPA